VILTWASSSGHLLFYVDGVLVDDLHGVRLGIILGDISSAYRKIHDEPQGDETDEKEK
jgi:hypothetical protein